MLNYQILHFGILLHIACILHAPAPSIQLPPKLLREYIENKIRSHPKLQSFIPNTYMATTK